MAPEGAGSSQVLVMRRKAMGARRRRRVMAVVLCCGSLRGVCSVAAYGGGQSLVSKGVSSPGAVLATLSIASCIGNFTSFFIPGPAHRWAASRKYMAKHTKPSVTSMRPGASQGRLHRRTHFKTAVSCDMCCPVYGTAGGTFLALS